MKRAETVDGALAPTLTKWDRQVLAAIGRDEWRSPWRIAETVGEDDVAYVRSTLRGLEDRHLCWQSHRFPINRREWIRTDAGDAYLESS